MLSLFVLYIYVVINHGGSAPTTTPVCVAYGFTDQASAQAAGEAINMTRQIPIPGDPIDPARVESLEFMVLPLYAAPTESCPAT